MTPFRKYAQRVAMLAIATLLARTASSQTADELGCQQAVASSGVAVTVPRIADLSYRCMKLPDGSRVWVGVANNAARRTVLLVQDRKSVV